MPKFIFAYDDGLSDILCFITKVIKIYWTCCKES